MERYVVFAGMLIHAIHYFNRSFTRTTMNKPRLVLMKQKMFVEEEGQPASHRTRN
jgi:hypothetical protein